MNPVGIKKITAALVILSLILFTASKTASTLHPYSAS